jgi:hypothetical protein
MQQKTFDLNTLNGINGFMLPGIASGGDLGISVSTAGDINGDNITDLVLGANAANSFNGAAYVIFGSRGGFVSPFNLNNLNGINGFMVPGIASGGNLGISVSTAGDINGDNITDLVLGAHYANAYNGAAYVIFGSRGGFASPFNLTNLNGNNGFMVPGIVSGDILGYSVSTAGDINGDNITDLVLGAHYANSNNGAAYVIFGSRGGFVSPFNLNNLNGINGFMVPGIASGGWLGVSVSTAGDINGDNITDLVLGARAANAQNGTAYVIFGSRGGFVSSFNLNNLNGNNGFMVPGIASGGQLGWSVSTAGDINGDNITDLVLGAWSANSFNGTAYVIFGSRGGFISPLNLANLNGSNGFTVPAIASGDQLGTSVSTAGDINGDNIPDLVLGADGANSGDGTACVIFGSRGEFVSPFNLTNLNGNNGFMVPGIVSGGVLGYSVSTAGDINGDNITDLVLGALGANSGGTAYVIFGTPFLWINNQMTITQGQSLLLTNAQLNVRDFSNTAANLVFTVSNLQGGRFELVSNLGASITTFTQQDINTSQVRFVSDRTAVVAYDVSVSNSRLSSTSPAPANITFTNHPPIVLAAPLAQIIEVNRPFNFAFKADQVFNDTDGDPLAFFAESTDGSPLPSWIQFDNNQTNQLRFTGTPPTLGDSRFSLFAQDPLNATAHTDFDVLAVPATNLAFVTVLPNQQSVSIYYHGGYYYAQVLNSTGAVLGSPIYLTPFFPSVTVLPNSNFILTYPNGTQYTVREFNPNAVSTTDLGISDSPPTLTVLSNQNVVLTYQNASNYYEQVFDVNGTSLGNPLLFSNTAPQVVSVAMGNFVMLYQNATGYYAQVVNNNSSLIGIPTPLPSSSAQATPLSNGNFVVTYQNATGSYIQLFNATGLPIGNAISSATGTSVTALPNNNAIFTYQNGTRYYSQIVSNVGNAIGDTLSFATPPTTTVLPNGNFVAAYQNGTNYHTQLFNASGIGLGNEITSTYSPALTPLPNGGFILSYTKGSESYAQVFDDQGNPIDTTLSFGGTSLQITPLTNQFVLTYQQESTTYIRLFTLQGLAIGNENQLAGDPRSVTAFGNGQFVVMYQNGLNYYTQLFTSNGTEIGFPAQLSGSTPVVNRPPVVLNAPRLQTVLVNQPFSFQLDSTQIFNGTDGNSLTFFAKTENDGSLPSWIQFDQSNASHLNFSGTAPAVGDTRLQLFAKDPLNQVVQTPLDIFAQAPTTNPAISIGAGVAGGLVGLAALVGGAFGFWRHTTHKNSRKNEQLADFIRSTLNLKGVDNFNHETGQKYLTFVHGLQNGLQQAGIDTSSMRPTELHALAQDVASAARNKITPATDCFGGSEITVHDLTSKTQEMITEIQTLRAGNVHEITPTTSIFRPK